MIGLNYIGFSSYLYLQVEKGLLTTFKTQLLKKLTLLTLVLSFNKSTNQPKYLLEIYTLQSIGPCRRSKKLTLHMISYIKNNVSIISISSLVSKVRKCSYGAYVAAL